MKSHPSSLKCACWLGHLFCLFVGWHFFLSEQLKLLKLVLRIQQLQQGPSGVPHQALSGSNVWQWKLFLAVTVKKFGSSSQWVISVSSWPFHCVWGWELEKLAPQPEKDGVPEGFSEGIFGWQEWVIPNPEIEVLEMDWKSFWTLP